MNSRFRPESQGRTELVYSSSLSQEFVSTYLHREICFLFLLFPKFNKHCSEGRQLYNKELKNSVSTRDVSFELLRRRMSINEEQSNKK